MKETFKKLQKTDNIFIFLIVCFVARSINLLIGSFFEKGLIVGTISILLLCVLCFLLINKVTARLNARNVLLVGIIIFFVGVEFSRYINDTSANIVWGIGSSVLASWIFYTLIEKRVATLLGNIDVKRIDLFSFIEQIQKNYEINVFRIMDTWTELVSDNFYDQFERAISNRHDIKLEVLLANPYSKVIEQRGEDLGKDIHTISEEGISKLFKLFNNYRNNLDIKLYDTTISVRFYSWDTRAFFSVYPPRNQAENEANLEIFTASTLGNYVIKHFEQIWNSEKSIKISRHMKICLNPSNNKGWEDDKEVFYCIDKTSGDIYIFVIYQKQRFFLESQEGKKNPTKFLIDQIFVTEFFSGVNSIKLNKNIDIKEGYVSLRGLFEKLDVQLDSYLNEQENVKNLFLRRYGGNNNELNPHFADPTFFKINIEKCESFKA